MLMPRQSSYPQQQYAGHAQMHTGMSEHQLPYQISSSLQQCVSSTANCVQTMRDAIDTLDFAIQDHPRLMTIFKSQRHFDLVSERDIASARSHVSGEVLPHINELLQRASVEMERQERRAVALRNKAESQQQTLQNIRSIDQHASKLNKPTSAAAPPKQSEQALELEQSLQEQRQRLATLKKRKEALLNKADELENET